MKNSSTKKHKGIQDKIDLIVYVSEFNNNDVKSKVYDFFCINNYLCYTNIEYEQPVPKKGRDNMHEIGKRSVKKWIYNNICARIDTNQFKFKNFGEEKYPIRIWNTIYWTCYLEKFHEGEIYKKYQDAYAGLRIGRTRFGEFICSYIDESLSETYVDIHMLALSKIIVSLGTAVRKLPNLKSSLEQCKCLLYIKI